MNIGMLQIEKPVIPHVHKITVISFTITELLALKFKTLACNEILTGAPWTPIVTQSEM